LSGDGSRSAHIKKDIGETHVQVTADCAVIGFLFSAKNERLAQLLFNDLLAQWYLPVIYAYRQRGLKGLTNSCLLSSARRRGGLSCSFLAMRNRVGSTCNGINFFAVRAGA